LRLRRALCYIEPMSGALRSSSTSIILILVISLISDQGSAAEKKAAVSRTPTANLRAGAGVEHALKLTFKEGDQVTGEKLEGERFLVAAADGQKGKSSKTATPPTPAAVAPQRAPEARSQSILQMIEGHEAEVKIAALVAAIAFVAGWFCGGSYYIRRERKARRKLRF